MMAYCCLHYCMRGCTYTIMGDTSQNIHFGYGLNDWEELRKLVLTGTYDAFGLLKKVIEIQLRFPILPRIYCAMVILQFTLWSQL